MAWFTILAFNTVDRLMLGVLSNPQQAGLYSASYPSLNEVSISYYMLTGGLYPQFSRRDPSQRPRMSRPAIRLALFAVGCVLATPVAHYRAHSLSILFGDPFVAAAPLLLPAYCIPLDFLTSYPSNAYFAWSTERHVLKCALLAADTDVVLNLYLIPLLYMELWQLPSIP